MVEYYRTRIHFFHIFIIYMNFLFTSEKKCDIIMKSECVHTSCSVV